MKVSLFEISYNKKWTFHNIQIFWDAPVYIYIYIYILYVLYVDIYR